MDSNQKIIASYNRFIPHKLFQLLNKDQAHDLRLGDQVEKTVTILYSDIRNYSEFAAALTAKENINFINRNRCAINANARNMGTFQRLIHRNDSQPVGEY